MSSSKVKQRRVASATPAVNNDRAESAPDDEVKQADHVTAASSTVAASAEETSASSASTSPTPRVPRVVVPILSYSSSISYHPLRLVVLITVLGIYLSTVYPSVTGGDSGELLLTTCNLGIAHPPGYPLYTMLGWGWSEFIMRWGHRAYRVNCMCSCMGSVAAALIAYSAAMLAQRTRADAGSESSLTISSHVVGFLSGIGFALMPTVWLYSIQSEVFALNNLLCSMLIAATVHYYSKEQRLQEEREAVERSKREDEGTTPDVTPVDAASIEASTPAGSISPSTLVSLSYLGAFICGLCLTNQHTTVFPVLVTSAFITFSLLSNGLLRWWRVPLLILAVLVGMSPYLYTLIRSHWTVIDSWGDQRTLDGFLTHLLRKEYGTFQLASSDISEDPGMINRMGVYVQNMMEEMMSAAPFFAVIGLYATLFSPSRGTRRASFCLLLGYLLYVVVFHKLANLDMRPLFLGVQARFWQQANMYVWIFSGVGVKYTFQTALHVLAWVSRCGGGENNKSPSTLFRILLTFACLLYTGGFMSWQLWIQYPIHNHSDNDSFFLHGEAILNSFPQNSIVLLNGDLNNNLVKYPQQCEGTRPDLSLLSLQLMSWDWFVPTQRKNYPEVKFPGIRYHVSTPNSFNIKRFLDANYKTTAKKGGGIFLCGPFKDGDNSNVKGLSAAPSGNSNDPPIKVLHYEEHPFGLCSQLLPGSGETNQLLQAGFTDFNRRGFDGLISFSKLPEWDPVRFANHTWEAVLYSDLSNRLKFLTSVASFHSNKNIGDPASLQLAFDMTEQLMSPASEAFMRYLGTISDYEYRSSGVIYGMMAKQVIEAVTSKTPSEERARRSHLSGVYGRKMLLCWMKYIRMKPNDSEMIPHVRARVNPYNGRAIEGLDEDPEYLAFMREEKEEKEEQQKQRRERVKANKEKKEQQQKEQQQPKPSQPSQSSQPQQPPQKQPQKQKEKKEKPQAEKPKEKPTTKEEKPKKIWEKKEKPIAKEEDTVIYDENKPIRRGEAPKPVSRSTSEPETPPVDLEKIPARKPKPKQQPTKV